MLPSRLISAVHSGAHGGSEVSAEALRYAIKQYVQRHLRDPGLSPAVIARACHISGRHLYNVWKDEQVTIARWIGQQRLEAAR
jgi:AraC-like DNA-binding protein